MEHGLYQAILNGFLLTQDVLETLSILIMFSSKVLLVVRSRV